MRASPAEAEERSRASEAQTGNISSGSYRGVTVGLLVLAAGVLVFAAWQVTLRLPQYFEIDYGEGFVWSQVSDLLAGRLYRTLSQYPIALMHYTPLFHAATALMWKSGVDPLLGGRLVSLIAGLALVAACGTLAYLAVPIVPPGRRRLAALAAIALAMGTPEIIEWSTLMRVDMLATSLGTLGLSALAWSDRRGWALPLAAACFLLALCAKQSAVAPAIAGTAALLWARPRAGLLLGGSIALVGALLVAGAEVATAGEFLRHTVLYDAARIRWDQLILLWLPLLAKSAVLIAIALGFTALTLVTVMRRRAQRADTQTWLRLALSLNLGLGLVFSLGTAKVGAGSSYMLPLLAPAAILAAVALAEYPGRAPILFAALAAQTMVGLATYPFPTRSELSERDRVDTQLMLMMDGVAGPVLSENMSLLMRAGRPVPWEFGSITELTLLGIFDEAPLVQRFRDRWFKMLIIETWEPQRYTPAIRETAQSNYEEVDELPPYEVWLPK
jgi:hypothetical protein